MTGSQIRSLCIYAPLSVLFGGLVWYLVVAQVSEGDYLTGSVLMLTSLICHIFTFSELNHAFDLLATIKRATQSQGSRPIVSVRWSLPKYS